MLTRDVLSRLRPDESERLARAKAQGYCVLTSVTQRHALAWNRWCDVERIADVKVTHRRTRALVSVDVLPRGRALSEREATVITLALHDACRGRWRGTHAHHGANYVYFDGVPRERAEDLAQRIVQALSGREAPA